MSELNTLYKKLFKNTDDEKLATKPKKKSNKKQPKTI